MLLNTHISNLTIGASAEFCAVVRDTNQYGSILISSYLYSNGEMIRENQGGGVNLDLIFASDRYEVRAKTPGTYVITRLYTSEEKVCAIGDVILTVLRSGSRDLFAVVKK